MRVWIVRHGCAGRKGDWSGNDEDRPLDHVGEEQADALRSVLVPTEPSVLCSSPARRCRDTLRPTAAALGLPIHDVTVLRPSDDAAAVSEFIHALPDRAVVCTHGEVMTPLLALFALSGFDIRAACAEQDMVHKGTAWRVDLEERSLLHVAPIALVDCVAHPAPLR